jgi:hypothetical protein
MLVVILHTLWNVCGNLHGSAMARQKKGEQLSGLLGRTEDDDNFNVHAEFSDS